MSATSSTGSSCHREPPPRHTPCAAGCSTRRADSPIGPFAAPRRDGSCGRSRGAHSEIRSAHGAGRSADTTEREGAMTTSEVSDGAPATREEGDRGVAPRSVWALGDYHAFATRTVWELGPVLVEACGIGAGMRVLDVAAG